MGRRTSRGAVQIDLYDGVPCIIDAVVRAHDARKREEAVPVPGLDVAGYLNLCCTAGTHGALVTDEIGVIR